MMHPDRMITTEEVLKTIMNGEIIEDYPDDSRGHSCLLLGAGQDDRPIHVVCSPKEEYLAVITAYLPRKADWEADYMTRRGP